MPKFHFHICTTFEIIRDTVGRNLQDVYGAERFASRYARLLMGKAAYRQIDFRVIEIRNELGRLVATLRFSDIHCSITREAHQAITAPEATTSTASSGDRMKTTRVPMVHGPRAILAALLLK